MAAGARPSSSPASISLVLPVLQGPSPPPSPSSARAGGHGGAADGGAAELQWQSGGERHPLLLPPLLGLRRRSSPLGREASRSACAQPATRAARSPVRPAMATRAARRSPAELEAAPVELEDEPEAACLPSSRPSEARAAAAEAAGERAEVPQRPARARADVWPARRRATERPWRQGGAGVGAELWRRYGVSR